MWHQHSVWSFLVDLRRKVVAKIRTEFSFLIPILQRKVTIKSLIPYLITKWKIKMRMMMILSVCELIIPSRKSQFCNNRPGHTHDWAENCTDLHTYSHTHREQRLRHYCVLLWNMIFQSFTILSWFQPSKCGKIKLTSLRSSTHFLTGFVFVQKLFVSFLHNGHNSSFVFIFGFVKSWKMAFLVLDHQFPVSCHA